MQLFVCEKMMEGLEGVSVVGAFKSMTSSSTEVNLKKMLINGAAHLTVIHLCYTE